MLFLFSGARPFHARGFISSSWATTSAATRVARRSRIATTSARNSGVAVSAVGPIVGFEEELGYTKNFFGATVGQTSNVLTLMSNFMVSPRFGPVQPYGLAGIGLIRTSVEAVGTTTDENQFGWDIGGGLLVFFGAHFGVRGDVRYYHAFQVLDFLNIQLPGVGGQKLDYGRAAAAVVFKF